MTLLRPLLSLVLTLVLTVPLAAQKQDLETLSAELARRWTVERARAESLAVEYGMPIRTEDPDGTVRELVRFTDGRPVYFKTDNHNSAKTISTNKVHPFGGAGYLLTGGDVTLGEWDGGGVRTTHREFGTRVLSTQGAVNFHATHVAGTIMAAGIAGSAKGMSYGAFLKAFDWNSDESEMAAQAALGLRVSNHSYGLITGWDFDYFGDGKWAWFGDPNVHPTEDYSFGFYDGTASSWDLIASNAPYYLIVKSAGNDRDEGPAGIIKHWVFNGGWDTVLAHRSIDGNGGYDCLSNSSVAKNLLVVGAVSDLVNGYTSPLTVSLSSFTAWGPTDDGRIKPDVVANGVSLTSTYHTHDSAYANLSGTSMAAPSVTGSVGLLLEHHKLLHGNDSIRSSTMKAIVIHTADEVGSNAGPDYRAGWGLMNTRSAADLMTLDTTDGAGSHIRVVTLALGGVTRIDVSSTGAGPMKATICWTEPPGTSPSPALDPPTSMLLNDVDMRLVRRSDGAVFRPWVLNPASPAAAATTGDNTRDNVEQIFISSPGIADYTVELTHKGALTSLPLHVSLVMSGNTAMPAQAPTVFVDTLEYSLVPGATHTDSFVVYNSRPEAVSGAVAPDAGGFWLDPDGDSLTVAALDSAMLVFTIDGSLWSQWTTHTTVLSFPAGDPSATPASVVVKVNVLGPTIANAPASFVFNLDSAEIGMDTIIVRNDGHTPLDVVVKDTSGSLPSWLTLDADTLAIPPGDSATVALAVNASDEPPGNYGTILELTSNDSATGTVTVPVLARIATETFTIVDVAALWNLVSMPVEPVSGAKTTLFPTALTAAFGFNGSYYEEDTLRPGWGYWLKFGSPESVPIDGYYFDRDTIPLIAGWNLVGSLHEGIPVASVVTDPAGILVSEFYRYAGGYQASDSILPGKGYWVQTSQPGDLHVEVAPAAAPKAMAARRPVADMNSVTVADGRSGSRTLWFAAGRPAPVNRALPPRPPRGAFDARFDDDSFAASFEDAGETRRSRRILVESSGTELRFTAAIAGKDAVRWFLREEDGSVHELSDGGTVVLRSGPQGGTVVELVAGGPDLPAEFALGQNYPNPFNPATTISFSIPEEAMVSIRLYNVLGNEVRSIASGRFEAGRHEVEFDAGNLSSGVYVYTMRAGAFVQSRKMILMR